MLISQEQLARVTAIIEQLDEHLQQPPENRRRADRVKARFPLEVLILSGPAPVPLEVYSRNLSASGIAFMSRRAFQPDERVVLSLKIPNRQGKMIFARATFSRYLRGGLHEVGAQFLECITTHTGRERVPPHWLNEASRQREAARAAAAEPSPGAEKPAATKPGEKPAEPSEMKDSKQDPEHKAAQENAVATPAAPAAV